MEIGTVNGPVEDILDQLQRADDDVSAADRCLDELHREAERQEMLNGIYDNVAESGTISIADVTQINQLSPGTLSNVAGFTIRPTAAGVSAALEAMKGSQKVGLAVGIVGLILMVAGIVGHILENQRRNKQIDQIKAASDHINKTTEAITRNVEEAEARMAALRSKRTDAQRAELAATRAKAAAAKKQAMADIDEFLDLHGITDPKLKQKIENFADLVPYLTGREFNAAVGGQIREKVVRTTYYSIAAGPGKGIHYVELVNQLGTILGKLIDFSSKCIDHIDRFKNGDLNDLNYGNFPKWDKYGTNVLPMLPNNKAVPINLDERFVIGDVSTYFTNLFELMHGGNKSVDEIDPRRDGIQAVDLAVKSGTAQSIAAGLDKGLEEINHSIKELEAMKKKRATFDQMQDRLNEAGTMAPHSLKAMLHDIDHALRVAHWISSYIAKSGNANRSGIHRLTELADVRSRIIKLALNYSMANVQATLN